MKKWPRWLVIAEKLGEEVWLNKSGDVVSNEEGALGMKTKCILKHPNTTHIC